MSGSVLGGFSGSFVQPSNVLVSGPSCFAEKLLLPMPLNLTLALPLPLQLAPALPLPMHLPHPWKWIQFLQLFSGRRQLPLLVYRLHRLHGLHGVTMSHEAFGLYKVCRIC